MHAVLTLNGRTLLNHPLEEWQERPPEALLKLLDPNCSPLPRDPNSITLPWMKAAILFLADAAMQNVSVEIHVLTSDIGFNLAVQYPGGPRIRT